MIYVQPLDAVNSKIECDRATAQLIQSWFSFVVPDAEFRAKAMEAKYGKAAARKWDGTIKLFKLNERKLPNGLIPALVENATRVGLKVAIGEGQAFDTNDVDDDDLKARIAALKLPYELHDHQYKAIKHCLEEKRGVILSPTSSGKSLIMYCVAMLSKAPRILVMTTRINLVSQLADDFVEYGYDRSKIHEMGDGASKETDCDVTISTWQTAVKMDADWFNQFDMILADEAHNYDAKTLKNSLERATKVYWRLGFTGTLDGSLTHEMCLAGLFGPVVKFITIAEMVKLELIPIPKITFVTLNYSEEERRQAVKFQYLDEQDFIMSHEKRNRFLLKMGNSLDRNVLVLFEQVARHGKPLYDMANAVNWRKKETRYIHGGVKAKQRDIIKKSLEETNDNLALATFGTFQEGISINNLSHLILAITTTSPIRLLQSMGRMFRRHDDIPFVNIFIIIDDLTWKRPNYSMRHMEHQMKILNDEGLTFEFANVQLS